MFGVTGPDHAVLFPASDEDLADHVYEHLFGSEGPGTAVAVLAPQTRWGLTDRMERAGSNVAAAYAKGSFVTLDAGETLAKFMVAGWPDAAAFWQTMNPVLNRAEARPGEVRVFGEMVSLLWDSGQTAAAVDLEALWNELARRYSFSLLCAYPADATAEPENADELAQVLTAHSAVVPALAGGASDQHRRSARSWVHPFRR